MILKNPLYAERNIFVCPLLVKRCWYDMDVKITIKTVIAKEFAEKVQKSHHIQDMAAV